MPSVQTSTDLPAANCARFCFFRARNMYRLSIFAAPQGPSYNRASKCKCPPKNLVPPPPPPSVGGSDLNSSNSGCARLGSGVGPPLGVVEKEVAVLIVLVRWHRRAVGAAMRRAVDDEVPGAVEEEAGPAAVRRVPPGLLDALPVCFYNSIGSWRGRNRAKSPVECSPVALQSEFERETLIPVLSVHASKVPLGPHVTSPLTYLLILVCYLLLFSSSNQGSVGTEDF